jgi:ferredoxin
MINLKINDIAVQITEGQTLLQAANKAGIDIPTLCYNGNLDHFTSCMVCIVKDKASGKLLPSCSVKAVEGMEVICGDEEVLEARQMALELLLSEHVGDCEAPCRIACPAFMDIPQMNRLIAAGQFQQALEVVMKDIALPGVLGRICSAPCENACKRKPIDQPISVCLLKRYSADAATTTPAFKKETSRNRKIAIVGSGPAGLSAAFYLQLDGFQAVVFDTNPLPGGTLRYAVPDEDLDKAVLDHEIAVIQDLGVEFNQNFCIDADTFYDLRQNYDAVVLATGNYSPAMASWGLGNNGKQIMVDKSNYLTNLERVFAIGNANRSMKLAIRSAAQGKEVAKCVAQLVAGEPVIGEVRLFNSTIGKLVQQEYSEYLKEGSLDKRYEPSGGPESGFAEEVARKEAARCMHCDCRKLHDCKLRAFSHQYNVSKKRFAYTTRKPVKKVIQQDVIVYEPGKCIKCSICVRITARQKEKFGFTFIGRGFNVEIGAPFNRDLGIALGKTARMVAEACPTGALAMIEKDPNKNNNNAPE